MTAIDLSNSTDAKTAVKLTQSYTSRVVRTLRKFVGTKPLGAACGLLVVFFLVVGDLVPEVANQVTNLAGFGTPVPYLADELAERTSFIYPYEEQDLRARLQGSSPLHLLGTDPIGRDVLSRLLYGARTAIVIAVCATILSVVIQLGINIPTAYYGGWYDKIGYRLIDAIGALPPIMIMLVILGLFGSGIWEIVVLLGILYGLSGRHVRAQALVIMAQPFMEAARMAGASDFRIMRRYIWPSIVPIILVTATGRLGAIVLVEASLSFLGYGVPPPFPSWGQMLSIEGREYMRTAPTLALYPGVAITLLVFSFNIFGDALRDVLDPRMRGKR